MSHWLFQPGHRSMAPSGEACRHAKLTSDCVESIRSAVRQREALREHIRTQLTDDAIAKKYGITKRQVQRIASRECWAELSEAA